MSSPSFQITAPAFLSEALGPPLLGAYLATLHRGRFYLPVALRAPLQRSAVGHLGIYVNKDHVEIVPLRPAGPVTSPDPFLLTLAPGGIASIKVTAVSDRARIGIPKHFAEAAGLDPVLLLVGMKDRIEVWNTMRYFAKRSHDTTARRSLPCGRLVSIISEPKQVVKDAAL